MTTRAALGVVTPALLAAAGTIGGGTISHARRPLDRTAAPLVAAGCSGFYS